MKELMAQNPEHKALARLILARRDIRHAQKAADYIIENVKAVNDRMFEPMTCVAVISYARPFVVTRGSGRISGRYEQFETERMRVLHFVIIDYRNRYIAHSDAEVNQVMLVPKGADVRWKTGKGALSSHGDLIRTRHLGIRTFPPFKELCLFQLLRIGEKITEEKTRLFG